MECVTRLSASIFSWFESILALNSVSISATYLIIKLKNSDSVVCMTPQSQIFRLSKSIFHASYITPDCPFKSNQRQAKFWFAKFDYVAGSTLPILTWRCDANRRAFETLCVLDSWKIWKNWLRSMMHAAESDLAVWCTLRSQTRWWDAHNGVFQKLLITWLRSGMHAAELESKVWCTQQSLTPRGGALCRVRLCGRMHIAELFKNSNISSKPKPNSKIF